MLATQQAIQHMMTSLGLPYQFRVWRGEQVMPFWIGKIYENASLNEDGITEGTVDLELTADGRTKDLEITKTIERIKDYISPAGTILAVGDARVILHYSGTLPVPTDAESLRRYRITLTFKEVRNYA